jgi:hypothetical protein
MRAALCCSELRYPKRQISPRFTGAPFGDGFDASLILLGVRTLSHGKGIGGALELQKQASSGREPKSEWAASPGGAVACGALSLYRETTGIESVHP